MTTQLGSVTARDGTRIAYRTYGEGELTLVCNNGYTTSSFYWKHVIEHFSPVARLVTWDLKGHGASEPAHSSVAVTVEDSVDDLRRVLDAVGAERAVLLGFSLGCQIIIEAWRHIPDRIAALIPILGTYEHPFDGLLHPRFGAVAARAFELLAPYLGAGGLRTTSRLGRYRPFHAANKLTGLVGRRLEHAAMEPFYAHLAQIHPPTWVAMGVAAQRHSARDLLPTIGVPVLVLSGGHDVWTPAARGADMMREIPDCEQLIVPGAGHTGLFEYPDEICERIERFLTGRGMLSSDTSRRAGSDAPGL